jgi:hypothetical protein
VVALRNNLPAPLPLHRLEVRLADERGRWGDIARPGPPPAAAAAAGAKAAAAAPAAAGPAGEAADGEAAGEGSHLPPGRWRHFHMVLAPRLAGRLALEELALHLSLHSSVTWRLAALPLGQALVGSTSTLRSSGQHQPSEPLRPLWGVVPGVYELALAQVGPQPALELRQPDVCLAGGYAVVPCRLGSSGGVVSGATLELSLRCTGEEQQQQQQQLGPEQAAQQGQGQGGGQGGSRRSTSDGSTGGASFAGFKVRLPCGAALQDVAPDGARLPLPDFSGEAPLELELLVMRPAPGPALLTAAVVPPAGAAGAAGGGGGWPQPQQLELQFEAPFESCIRLCSESGVHTLTIPSRAYRAAGGAVPLAIGQPVVALATVRSLQQCPLEVGRGAAAGPPCMLALRAPLRCAPATATCNWPCSGPYPPYPPQRLLPSIAPKPPNPHPPPPRRRWWTCRCRWTRARACSC